MTQDEAIQARFVYDGDGNRVKTIINGTTTIYIGNYYEKSGGIETKYYYADGSRIAMRQGSTLYFLLSDHLGSTTVTLDSGGTRSAELRYLPWGGNRYTWGTTPTAMRYT